MKLLLAGLCLITAALLVISCGDDNTATKDEDSQQESSHSEAAHTEAKADDGLVLNDGKKWQMDDHTRDIFAQMSSSFAGTDLATLDQEGLLAAGAGLMVNINQLIQGCTMTGPDHDQLHVYLMLYIPAVEALAKNGQVEDAKMAQHYLKIYGDYFE